MRTLPALVLLASALAGPCALAQQLTADAIMARVAAHQDAAEAARSHYVYVQHVRTLSRKGRTVRCEEITDTRITPTPTGYDQQLLHLDGRVLRRKGGYASYNTLEQARGIDSRDDADISIHMGDKDEDTDRDLVEHMRNNLVSAKSKDGISAHLFPLNTASQAHMLFTLVGREPMNGRATFHIRFNPKDNSDYDWKGDAWIDAEAFEPVVVRTRLSKDIPLAVRMLLGTSVPGLGFTVTYAPQPEDRPDAVWFPASFGTEFKLRVLFFFNREIVLSASNRDFEQTHTSSHIVAEAPVAP